MKKSLWVLSGVSLAVLVACGGGSSSSSGTSTLNGQYVDAPTAGLTYLASPSGLSGVTDASGNFTFAAGDTVTFSVKSTDPNVIVPLGTITPVSPASTGATSIVSVLNFPNGNEIAQAIQSFATNGFDFRNVTISPANASSLATYINSGGVTAAPTPPSGSFVSSDSAMNTALQYVLKLTTQPVSNVASVISGKTFFSVSTFTDSGGTVNPNANIIYLAPNGSYYEICTNTLFDGLTPNPCSVNNGNPKTHVGSWAVVTGASNSFTLSGTAYNGYGDTDYVGTIAAPILDASKGIFTASQTNSDMPAISGTGTGKYQTVKAAFAIDSLAGKSLTVSGFGSCTDGQRKYTFQQGSGTSLPYSWTCPAGYNAGGAAKSGAATNASIASTAIPGVVVMTDAGSTDPLYVGLTTDSNSNSGTAMVAKVGNAGSGCTSSAPTNCTGYVKSRAFTLQ